MLPNKKNTKKEIIIGFIVGIIANTLGTILYILLFSKFSIKETFQAAIQEGHIGSLLALGALLNLIAFFLFLRSILLMLTKLYQSEFALLSLILYQKIRLINLIVDYPFYKNLLNIFLNFF